MSDERCDRHKNCVLPRYHVGPPVADFDCPGVPLKDHPYVWPDLPTAEQLNLDMLMTGSAYLDAQTGERIAPEDVVTADGVPQLVGVVQDEVVIQVATPELSTAMVDLLLAEVEATPLLEFTTQDEFLTALADLLDGALHPDTCSIDPDGTYCSCYIAKVREALPRCPVTKTVQVLDERSDPFSTEALVAARHVVHWTCVRTAHPASPDRHTFAAGQWS
jgi:hypothetical protein